MSYTAIRTQSIDHQLRVWLINWRNIVAHIRSHTVCPNRAKDLENASCDLLVRCCRFLVQPWVNIVDRSNRLIANTSVLRASVCVDRRSKSVRVVRANVYRLRCAAWRRLWWWCDNYLQIHSANCQQALSALHTNPHNNANDCWCEIYGHMRIAVSAADFYICIIWLTKQSGWWCG